jgi:hypothetical protein
MVNQLSLSRILMIAVVALAVGCVTLAAQEAPAPESSKPAGSNTPAPAPAEAQKGQAAGNITREMLVPKIIEPWNTPSLEGSELKSSDAVSLGEVNTVDGVYTDEVQRVMWRPADPIDLYIIKPVGVKNPPVILYLYSYPFEIDRYYNHDFCKFLVRNGVAAVGFASALTGPRYHMRPMKEWFVSQLDESLATSAHDVQMILNYLGQRGDLDMSRVGMWGDGSGASIAILAAAADARIKTLDLIDPWGDWPDWIAKSTRIPDNERPGFLKPEWLKHVEPLDPVKWLPQLKMQKVRLQFVKSVGITPLETQSKMEAAAPPNAQVVHYDSAAAFKGAAADGSGLDWIKQQVLQGGAGKEYHSVDEGPSSTSSAPERRSRQ